MEEAAIKKRALREVGDVGRDAVWEITLPQATDGGTWTLGFGGLTTGAIAAFADYEQVQAAMELLLSIGAGNVLVTGIPRGPFRIQFKGTLGGQPLPKEVYPLFADGSGLNPPVMLPPIQLDAGDAPILTSVANELYLDFAGVKNPEARFLKLKIALLETLLGGSHSAIDVQTAQRMEKFAQQHSNLLELLDRAVRELEKLTGTSATSARAGGSTSGKIRKQTTNGLPYGMVGRNPFTGRLS